FNATINKIDLNKKHPNSIIVGTIGGADTRENETDAGKNTYNNEAQQFSLRFEELQSVVYAKLVQKVGDRRYWEQWATSVAEIAERQIKRITQLVEKDGEHQKTFEEFLHGLQTNINPSVSKREAIEMLSQHSITKPVFEALFENYSFVQNNPVSVSIQNMITLLEQQTIENDTRSLNIFYESVRKRAAGIDNSEGKQRIIIELYDKFFKTAFPKLVEKLGIVYTPVEVVDFIIHSVNDILQQEFGRTLSDKNINIIDPFTGTGTFIVRLLQSGLITPEDLPRKYSTEIFANEIVLLAYYIASVNIENAYHDISSHSQYTRFNGICLADTFQLYESSSEKQFSSMFPENTERVVKQKQSRIQVIIGNPPYSVGQRSGNDNARNQSYPLLEEKIKNTYVKRSSTGLSKSSYDSYIKAFRWAADRIDSEEGIICFVSNGNWIEAKSQDGFRACIQDEFSKVYVFNLRGNIRADIGSSSRKEGGNIFGSQSMTQISITLLVKKKEKTTCDIYYHDIGDYLSRKEKLETIKNFKTISNIQYEKLSPNERGDWIKQGDELFNKFIPLWPQKKFDLSCKSFFNTHAIGVSSNRDSWVYNFSREKLKNNVGSFIDFYNRQRKKYHEHLRSSGHADINSVIDRDERKIKWTRSLKNKLIKNFEIIRDESSIIVSAYRPFSKQYLYYHHPIIECPGVMKRFFPAPDINNMVISLSGMSKNRFSLLMTNTITDLHCTGDSQIFPLYYFEETTQKNQGLFDTVIGNTAWTKKSAVSDYIHSIAVKLYGKSVTKEDIFFYVYGLLHSRHYQQKFAHDLRQSLPKLPLLESVKDFRQFSQKGRELADIHINYENEGKHPDIEIDGLENRNFTVRKMKFANPQHTDTIIVNNSITIRNIPPRAYDYTVNGKSAIKLVMEQYQAGIDRKSGMSNDPNDWAQEMRNPRYIVNLLISIITVSIKSVDIINSLPAPQWGEM
ncbi:MAG: type ISP restriction/modification enzyme, partial [Salinispira sp.]